MRGAIADDIAIRQMAKKTDVARIGKRLMIGRWVHGTGRRDNQAPGPNANPEACNHFGPAAEVENQKITLRWFDYWLKGDRERREGRAANSDFVMGETFLRYETSRR